MTRKPQKQKGKPPKWSIKTLDLQCVGMTHRLSVSTRRYLKARVESMPILIEFKREPHNLHDRNAIAVYGGGKDKEENPYFGMQLGYIPRRVAEVLAPAIDSGRAEFGTSLMVSVDELGGTAEIQGKLRVKRNFRLTLDMKEIA